MAVYVDTSAWIALKEPRDRNHAAAAARLGRLIDAKEALVTGWHTLNEFLDGLVRHYDQKTAALELARLTSSPRLLVEGTDAHHAEAARLFAARTDWNADISDCLSFALMTAKGIKRAFTYDQDFAKAGFETIG